MKMSIEVEANWAPWGHSPESATRHIKILDHYGEVTPAPESGRWMWSIRQCSNTRNIISGTADNEEMAKRKAVEAVRVEIAHSHRVHTEITSWIWDH